MSKSIDAKLRITAETAQATQALKSLNKAKNDLATPATRAGGKGALGDMTTGAAEAAAQVKNTTKAVDELKAAERAEAAEARRIARERKAADLQDRKEAEDARKRSLKEEQAAVDAAAKTQRQAQNQARQLAPQLTDIVVGLSTGQSPFTVLLQQGGQLKDVFGGVGGAWRALMSVFSAGRVLIGGAAAAIGYVAFEASRGVAESDALRKSIALTGNIAGTSAGQIDQLTDSIAQQQNTSRSSVREALTAVVSSGQFTATSLGAAGRAASALSKLTGETAAESVKHFDGMSDGVADWSAKTNKAYNFLSVQQFKYIQSLEAAGKPQEAMKVALEALATTMEQRSGPALGIFEKNWNAVKKVVSDTVDLMRSIGRDTTPEEKLTKLEARIARLREERKAGVAPSFQDIGEQTSLKVLDEQAAALREVIQLKNRSAAATSEAAEKTQKDIAKEGKGYSDQVSQLAVARAQQDLATTQAGLDKKQAAYELAYAKGLQGERDYNLQLNAIEVDRLKAQENFVQQSIDIEGGKKVTKPEDRLARDSAVQALKAQLIQVQGQISQAGTRAMVITSTSALQDAHDTSARWADVWRGAFDQLRQLGQASAADAAERLADPVSRARAQAEAATLGARQQLATQLTDIDREIDLSAGRSAQAAQAASEAKTAADRETLQSRAVILAAQREELLIVRQRLATEGELAIAEQIRLATLASLKAQFTEQMQKLALAEQAIEEGKALGVEEAERRKFAARDAAIVQLQLLVDLQNKLAGKPAEKIDTAQSQAAVDKLKVKVTEFNSAMNSAARTGFTEFLNSLDDRTTSLGDKFKTLFTSILKSAQNIVNQRLGEQLANSLIPKSGGGVWGAIGSFIAGQFHEGGVVGAGGTRREVNPAMFRLAPRYHSGGIAGLMPDEVPAVLRRGEEVLTANDPRHRNNSRGAGGNQISISVAVNGAQGSGADQGQAGNELASMLEDSVKLSIEVWARNEQRAGGILSGLGRGRPR